MAASYNELFGYGTHSGDADLEVYMLCQDNAASTTVVDESGQQTANHTKNTSTMSVTGPNSWLSNGLQTGVGEQIQFTGSDFVLTDSFSLLGWFKDDGTTNGNASLIAKVGGFNNLTGYTFQIRATTFQFFLTLGNTNPTRGSTIMPSSTIDSTKFGHGNWQHIALTTSTTSGTSNVSYYYDGSSFGGGTHTLTNSAYSGSAAVGGRSSSITNNFSSLDGYVAGVATFTRVLTSSEVDEAYSGPEPLNVSAPTTSGTFEYGQTVMATNGSWDSQSNGTVMYSYQWYVADDASGTNETAISGATSSSYSIGLSDQGKYIACEVAASNDGGNDSSENTFSSYTQVASGASFSPYWASHSTMIAG